MQEQKPNSISFEARQARYDFVKACRSTNTLIKSNGKAIVTPQADPTVSSSASPKQKTKASHPSIGFKGYLRLLKIFFSFCFFASRLFINRHDWRFRKQIPDAAVLQLKARSCG